MKDSVAFKIYEDPCAIHSIARAIIFEGASEIVQESLAPWNTFDLPVSDKDAGIYGVSPEGDIVGVLCFTEIRPKISCNVTLCYVEPSSRNQGLFTKMYGLLRSKFTVIGLSAHVSNPAAKHIAIKYGMSADSVTYLDTAGKG